MEEIRKYQISHLVKYRLNQKLTLLWA